MFAGLSGGASAALYSGQRQLELYQGLTDNPNMLGSLIVMGLPFWLWGAYKFRMKPPQKWIWIALVVIAIGLLARTYSRSSMLTAGMIGIGFCLSLKLRRTGFTLVCIAAALLFVVALSPAITNTAYTDYILKGTEETNGVLFSRRDIWAKSYENAKAGGWLGAGFGVTVGDTKFGGGLTAVGYGREKGNAQLAIIEETGIIGFGLYLILFLTLFTRLILAHKREKNSDLKVILGIITGSLAGFTVMSVFEAWWVAPGSAESAYFWTVAGVGLGLARRMTYRPVASTTSYTIQRSALSPAGFQRR